MAARLAPARPHAAQRAGAQAACAGAHGCGTARLHGSPAWPANSSTSSPSLIVLAIAGAFAYRLFGHAADAAGVGAERRVPAREPRSRRAAPTRDARDVARAARHARGNPALWTPAGYAPAQAGTGAAVFFIHPTSYLDRDHWNAPLDDAEANDRAALFLRGQASAFNEVGEIWAPRYRQATFGAFLTSERGRAAGARLRLSRRRSPRSTRSCRQAGPTARSSSPATARARST